MTLNKIAERLKISREKVRQMELRAIKKLKHPRNHKQWKEIEETLLSLSPDAKKVDC
jgi:DNA-directed RNA polymerase sigma subunit (sigma70/sigma32)